MVQSNKYKAQSGNDFQNSVFYKIHQIIGDVAIMKNKVRYNDVEIVYRQKKTESDIEITFPSKSRFKVICETTKTMRNDRDNDKYYNREIKATCKTRSENKELIINNIGEVLLSIIE